ncbi:MAG: methionyl-tRNA formyltransferase, partial [Gaiellales bacterium]
PVAQAARELGLPLIRTEDASAQPPEASAGAVVAFGQILRDPLLSAYPLVNLHPPLLPRWRGAAPVERAIMAGDTETGVAAMRVVAALDAGPVYAQERFPIGPDDDAGAVYGRALELGVPLLERALLGELEPVPQPREGVSYAPKLTPADRVLDWTRPAQELWRRIRALSPHIGARTELDGRSLVIWRARPVDDALEAGQVRPPLVIGCGVGALEVLELQPAGGRRMTTPEYLRGLRMPPSRAT